MPLAFKDVRGGGYSTIEGNLKAMQGDLAVGPGGFDLQANDPKTRHDRVLTALAKARAAYRLMGESA